MSFLILATLGNSRIEYFVLYIVYKKVSRVNILALKNPGSKPFPYLNFLRMRQFLPTFGPFETILGNKNTIY